MAEFSQGRVIQSAVAENKHSAAVRNLSTWEPRAL
jgi:hypothetical protein